MRPGDLDQLGPAGREAPRADAELRLDGQATLERLRGEWGELARHSANVFATWEWASTWWRHFGVAEPLITACRSADGQLRAILPLYRWPAGPLGVLRFLGHGPGDQLGPVCAPADSALAARALRRALAETCGRWEVFLGERLPGDRAWSQLLGAHPLQREASPVARLDGTSWTEFLAARSTKLRKQVQYTERRLGREHRLGYRLADDPERLPSDLDTLFALHRARFGEQAAAFGGREAFHREFAARALERGWLRLWFLELDGQAAAAWYGFRFAGADSFYQGGRDPAWARASVGLALVAHTIREAAGDGMREYRFLRGADAYKSRFADADPGLETTALARGPLGRAALGAVRGLVGAQARIARYRSS